MEIFLLHVSVFGYALVFGGVFFSCFCYSSLSIVLTIFSLQTIWPTTIDF